MTFWMQWEGSIIDATKITRQISKRCILIIRPSFDILHLNARQLGDRWLQKWQKLYIFVPKSPITISRIERQSLDRPPYFLDLLLTDYYVSKHLNHYVTDRNCIS